MFSLLSNGHIGSIRLARFGINFMSWRMEPIRERRCFSLFGGFKLSIESVFLMVGEIPVRVILYPS